MTHEGRSESASKAPSKLSSAVVTLIAVIPVMAAIVYGAVDSAAIGLLSVAVVLVVVLWIADAWRSGAFSFSTNTLQIPILGVIVIACVQLLPLASTEGAGLLSAPVSAAISMDPYATRFFLIRLAIFFVFFAACFAFIPHGSRPKRMATLIVTAGALLAFFGILQRLATPESIYGLRPTPQAIPFGPYVNQHHFAGLMEMTSGLALGMLFGSGLRRERKILIGIAAGVMGMAIIFTGSRGGLIAYLAVIAFATAASFARPALRREDHDGVPRRNRNLVLIAAATALIVLVFGSVLFLGGEQSLLRGIGLQESQTDISSGRSHFWWVAWQIFLANPVIGAGFDAFGVAFTRYDTWNGMFRVEQAHNDYLQMLADGGVLAFVCVATFIFLLFRKGIAAIGRETDGLSRGIATGALAGCFGILTHSFFDFPLRTPANALFFSLLIVLAVGRSGIVRKLDRRPVSEH